MKLYFDIEYLLKYNEGKNAKNCVNKIISLILPYSNTMYDIVNTFDDVIILDSSDEKKASYHLIFTKVVFANIMNCKSFVQSFLEQVSNSDISMLTAFDSNLMPKLIIDLAVYNKGKCQKQSVWHGLWRSLHFCTGHNSPYTLPKI